MRSMDPYQLSLIDFAGGHPEDPFRVEAAFTEWRRASRAEQRAFQRPLMAATGTHVTLEVDGREREVVNFASLDYLALNGHPRMRRAAHEAIDHWGSGAGAAPLLSGTNALHKALERDLAAWMKREAALLFSAGYTAGIGVAAALLRRGDVLIADEKTHVCWADGARLAGARYRTFAHDDVRDLERLLSQTKGQRRMVVVDALYSADGDLPSFRPILDACDAHGVGIISDEAHSAFALGEAGRGAAEQEGVRERVRLIVGTFSKSAGTGGFAVGDEELIEYMRLYANPANFSGALPPVMSAVGREAIRIAQDSPERRVTLADNAAYFRRGLAAIGLSSGASTTHVVPVMVGSARRLLYSAARRMLERGLYMIPVDFPVVPENALRYRVSISAAHTREDLDLALSILEEELAHPLAQAST